MLLRKLSWISLRTSTKKTNSSSETTPSPALLLKCCAIFFPIKCLKARLSLICEKISSKRLYKSSSLSIWDPRKFKFLSNYLIELIICFSLKLLTLTWFFNTNLLIFLHFFMINEKWHFVGLGLTERFKRVFVGFLLQIQWSL